MAINYSKVGWDTTKFVNPTSMNQMDNGIKAACDGVDSISSHITSKGSATRPVYFDSNGVAQQITNTVNNVASLSYTVVSTWT